MRTKVIPVKAGQPNASGYARLGQLLREGGLVVFPTESVYGIAASAACPDAVKRLYALKGRPADQPLAVLLTDGADLLRHAPEPAVAASRLIRRLWPGPLTLVLRDLDGGFTGFRLPDHTVALRLAAAAGTPLVSSSANRSGSSPAVNAKDAARVFSGSVEAVLTDGETKHRRPSTVVRVSGNGLELLREGVIPWQAVRMSAAHIVLFVCTGNLCRSPMAEGLFRALLAEKLGVKPGAVLDHGIHVLSAGTAGIIEEPATHHAVKAVERWGADITGHLSRPLTHVLIDRADEIIVAERRHAEKLAEWAPEAAGKTRLLLGEGVDLPDPIGRAEAVYQRAALRIREALIGFADRLAKQAVQEGE